MNSGFCVVHKCLNHHKQLDAWKTTFCEEHQCYFSAARCDCPPPFKSFGFPLQKQFPYRRKAWIRNVLLSYPDDVKPPQFNSRFQQSNWSPLFSRNVCSDHFVDGRPTAANPNPTLKMGHYGPIPDTERGYPMRGSDSDSDCEIIYVSDSDISKDGNESSHEASDVTMETTIIPTTSQNEINRDVTDLLFGMPVKERTSQSNASRRVTGPRIRMPLTGNTPGTVRPRVVANIPAEVPFKGDTSEHKTKHDVINVSVELPVNCGMLQSETNSEVTQKVSTLKRPAKPSEHNYASKYPKLIDKSTANKQLRPAQRNNVIKQLKPVERIDVRKPWKTAEKCYATKQVKSTVKSKKAVSSRTCDRKGVCCKYCKAYSREIVDLKQQLDTALKANDKTRALKEQRRYNVRLKAKIKALEEEKESMKSTINLVQIEIPIDSVDELIDKIASLNAQIAELEKANQELSTAPKPILIAQPYTSYSKQIVTEGQHSELRETAKQLETENSQLKSENPQTNTDKLLKTDRKVKFYTGLKNKGLYERLHCYMDKKIKNYGYWRGDAREKARVGRRQHRVFTEEHRQFRPKRKLSTSDELLMALMKFKLNLFNCDLSDRFEVSTSLTYVVLQTWRSVLTAELQHLVEWPYSQEDDIKAFNLKPDEVKNLKEIFYSIPNKYDVKPVEKLLDIADQEPAEQTLDILHDHLSYSDEPPVQVTGGTDSESGSGHARSGPSSPVQTLLMEVSDEDPVSSQNMEQHGHHSNEQYGAIKIEQYGTHNEEYGANDEPYDTKTVEQLGKTSNPNNQEHVYLVCSAGKQIYVRTNGPLLQQLANATPVSAP